MMEQSRRDFLGSVIGMLAASRLPFIAEATPTIIQLTDEERARILLGSPLSKLEKMIGVYYLKSGAIKSAPIKSVERTRNQVIFREQDWTATQAVNILGTAIITPYGESLTEKAFNEFRVSEPGTTSWSGSVFLNNGDTFKCTFIISLGGDEL